MARKFAYGSSRGTGNALPDQHRTYRPDYDLISGRDSAQVNVAHSRRGFVSESTNSTGLPNSPRGIDFHQLLEAISRLAELPSQDPMHIDRETSRYAMNLVGLLRGQFEIDVPKMFPQDAEALVLTWDEGTIKRLLTIAGEEVSLLDLNRATQYRCYHEVSDGHAAMADLMPLLAESARLRSTALED